MERQLAHYISWQTKYHAEQRAERRAGGVGQALLIQDKASDDCLARNVPTNLDEYFSGGFDPMVDVTNSSKGRVGGTNGRLVNNEEFIFVFRRDVGGI